MFSLILGGRGKLFLRIAGKIAKIVKIKNSCHTVSLVYLNFFCFVDSLSLYFRKTKKRSSRSYEKSFSAYEIFFNRVQYHWAVVRAAHRVKLSKLNQTGSTWTEFLSEENLFFQFVNSSIFIHCQPTRWKWTHSIFWTICIQSVYRLAFAFRRSHMALFIPVGRGLLHIMAYMMRLPAKGVPFLGFRYRKG